MRKTPFGGLLILWWRQYFGSIIPWKTWIVKGWKGKEKENICCILSYICICLWFYPTINIWPIDSIFDVKLFNSFSLSTDVLYFLAMEYRESPFCTIYVVSSGVLDGINRTWPMDKRLLVRLFNSFISSIVTLYFLAMEYKESPFFTV